MFNEILLEAIRERDSKLAKLKDDRYNDVLKEASSRWVNYDPLPEKCESAGVDSSWNKRAFQGLHLYVVTAIAITSTNRILASEHDFDIAVLAGKDLLETKAMGMEASVTQKALESKPDIVCVDGSLVARMENGRPDATDMIRKYGDAVFIAKTSNSRLQFKNLGSKAGDIYYYSHVSKAAGFSMPVRTEFRHMPVFETYARLRDYTPLVRIELVGTKWDTRENDIKRLLSMLRYHSVSGYPYCLKLAHNNCKVSNEDIDRLASIFSLQNEQGARDALNE